jgi:hypothetical protein
MMLGGKESVPDMATDQTPATPTDVGDCPLGTRWVSWTLGRLVNRGHVSPEECEAVLRARQATGWRTVRPLTVAWSTGPGDRTRTPDAPGLLVKRLHVHTTFTVAGQVVHVDWATGTSWGPFSTYSMARIYVGGVLRNECVHGGSSLGYSVCDAAEILAVLDPATAVSVGPVRYSETSRPTVWLMEPGRRRGVRRRQTRKDDARGSAEAIVEFLVDGGSVVLVRRRAPDGSRTFEVIADQAARFVHGG